MILPRRIISPPSVCCGSGAAQVEVELLISPDEDAGADSWSVSLTGDETVTTAIHKYSTTARVSPHASQSGTGARHVTLRCVFVAAMAPSGLCMHVLVRKACASLSQTATRAASPDDVHAGRSCGGLRHLVWSAWLCWHAQMPSSNNSQQPSYLYWSHPTQQCLRSLQLSLTPCSRSLSSS